MLFKLFVVIINEEITIPGGNGGAVLPGLSTAVNNIQHTHIYIYREREREFVFVKFYKFGLDMSSFVLSRKETT